MFGDGQLLNKRGKYCTLMFENVLIFPKRSGITNFFQIIEALQNNLRAIHELRIFVSKLYKTFVIEPKLSYLKIFNSKKKSNEKYELQKNIVVKKSAYQI